MSFSESFSDKMTRKHNTDTQKSSQLSSQRHVGFKKIQMVHAPSLRYIGFYLKSKAINPMAKNIVNKTLSAGVIFEIQLLRAEDIYSD